MRPDQRHNAACAIGDRVVVKSTDRYDGKQGRIEFYEGDPERTLPWGVRLDDKPTNLTFFKAEELVRDV